MPPVRVAGLTCRSMADIGYAPHHQIIDEVLVAGPVADGKPWVFPSQCYGSRFTIPGVFGVTDLWEVGKLVDKNRGLCNDINFPERLAEPYFSGIVSV